MTIEKIQYNTEEFKSLGKSRKVLIVDDMLENLAIARNAYERLGFEADCVQRPNEALDKIKQGGYTAVITDVMFPPELIDEETDKIYSSQLERAVNHVSDRNNTWVEFSLAQSILKVKAKQWGEKYPVLGCDKWETGTAIDVLYQYEILKTKGLKEKSSDSPNYCQKSVGTIIYEEARKFGIPSYMVTNLHSHGLENSAGIEIILLPLALEFPDIIYEDETGWCKFGNNHITPGANKSQVRFWVGGIDLHEFITSDTKLKRQIRKYFFNLATGRV